MVIDDTKLRELQAKAGDSELASNFAKSNFWLNILGPMIERRRQEYVRSTRWRPGRNANDAQLAGLNGAYFSGRADALEDLYAEINNMIRDGQEAMTTLAAIDAQKKKTAEVAK